MRPLLGCLLAAVLITTGCTLLEKDRSASPNRSPEAFLTGGPADGDLDTFYRVHFFWSGFDPDGRVVRYEWLLSNDEATGALIIDADIYARLAALGYTWTAATDFDGEFVVSADQFPDLDSPADSIYWEPDPLRFHAQHTFFVRAVDDDGAVSALPAHRTFTATTLAPEVWITHPVDLLAPGGYEMASTDIRLRWAGRDSLQDGTLIDPDSSRFALFTRADLPLDEPTGLLLTLPDSGWSPWRGWRDQDPGGAAGGRQVLLQDLTPAGGGGAAGYYQFFVQAKDEAGAVTSHFEDGVNLRRLRVLTSLRPTLALQSPLFGLRVCRGAASYLLEAAADLPIAVSWRGTAEDYGSEITGFRFGWDIQDPENDAEWSAWALDATSTEATYPAGEHRLRVQCEDLSGNRSEAQLDFLIAPLTLERDLLVVDDYDNSASENPWQCWPTGPAYTWGTFPLANLDQENFWRELLADYAGYEPAVDYLRLTIAQPTPSLALLGQYARTIWEVKESAPGASGLAHLARFVDPYAVTSTPQDLLSLWLRAGGRLLLCGSRPLHCLLPNSGEMADPDYERRQPVAFLRDLRLSMGTAAESQAAVQRFLPWRWLGLDASALPVNADPRALPGTGDDWPTDASYWGLIGTRLEPASLTEFGNALGWTPPDTLRFRPEVYDWFEDAASVFAPTSGRWGLSEAEVYNWDWLAGAYSPPLAYRESEYRPLAYYLPADSTTRWGKHPVQEHDATTPGGAHYCEACYALGAGRQHALAVVGLGAPETPSVLLGLTPYYLEDAAARGLIGHILTDIMALPR